MLLKNESEKAKIVLKDGYPLDLDFYPSIKEVNYDLQNQPCQHCNSRDKL